MENLHKGLIGFFASFISSQVSDPSLTSQLVSRMLRMKSVQRIIIKTLFKLEPIITSEVLTLKSSGSPKSSTSVARNSKLLLLSQDVKHLMNNYESIQGKLSSMMDIVDSLDYSVEHAPRTGGGKNEPPSELENFLLSIVKKKATTTDEIYEIRDDAWSKHMDVEKMLKAEMAKYYTNLEKIDEKYFNRITTVKHKAGIRISKLEEELRRTWHCFREQLDRALMVNEESLSRQYEIIAEEEKTLTHDFEVQVHDYASALHKIKSLLAVRKILEKRRTQDEKIASGLSNKISVLTDKYMEMRNLNGKIVENLTSLSFCLEMFVTKSNIPLLVKEKMSKYIQKQKCQKLEAICRIDEIFEAYSILTVSNKFDTLKEGIETVSHSIRDENVKIKINKLIAESKIEEVDKSEALKNIQIVKSTSLKKGKGPIVRTGARREMSKEKEAPKALSALESLKYAMSSIDEEIRRTDKAVEETIANAANISISESIRDDESGLNAKGNSRGASKNNRRQKLAPKVSENLSRTEVFSTQGEEILREYKETLKEDKEIQVSVTNRNAEVQVDFEIYNKLSVSLLRNKTRKASSLQEILGEISMKEMDDLLVNALNVVLSDKNDENTQTDKESGILDTSTPNNTIIRGLMNRVKTIKNDKPVLKKPGFFAEPNISDNLIIKKIFKTQGLDAKVFKTELKECVDVEEENPKIVITSEDRQSENIDGKGMKPNKTLPLHLSTLETKYQKLDQTLQEGKLRENNKKILGEKQKKLSGANNPFNQATDEYKQEFNLQIQMKGLKKANFEDIQKLWEEVITRRILEGETDKISLYLRGYLGTDKFDSEKERIISLIGSDSLNDVDKLSIPESKNAPRIALQRWKTIMHRIFARQALRFSSLIEPEDSPTDILFKAAKYLKFIKERLEKVSGRIKRNKKSLGNTELAIIYSSDKWSMNSISLTPVDRSNNKKKKHKLMNYKNETERFLRHKTPLQDKRTSDDITKLPYIKS